MVSRTVQASCSTGATRTEAGHPQNIYKGTVQCSAKDNQQDPEKSPQCRTPPGFRVQETSALATTYTCRWVRSRSTVTSFLTRSKRRRLLGTMFSRIDKESCCTEASIAFMLT